MSESASVSLSEANTLEDAEERSDEVLADGHHLIHSLFSTCPHA